MTKEATDWANKRKNKVFSYLKLVKNAGTVYLVVRSNNLQI